MTWRPIARRRTVAAGTEAHLALLRRNALFAPLPLTALDRLAERLVPVAFEPGDDVMRKGEPGEQYVLIAEGEVDVSDDATHLRLCGPGEGVGEIALLHRVPRTATVTAARRSSLRDRRRRRSWPRLPAPRLRRSLRPSSADAAGTLEAGDCARRVARTAASSLRPRPTAARPAPSRLPPPSSRGRELAGRSSRCTPACRSGHARRG